MSPAYKIWNIDQGGDIYLTNVGVNLGMAGVIPEKYIIMHYAIVNQNNVKAAHRKYIA